MEFYKHSPGEFALQVGDDVLLMTRQEAEDLFVDIGHTLKDDDIQEGIEDDG